MENCTLHLYSPPSPSRLSHQETPPGALSVHSNPLPSLTQLRASTHYNQTDQTNTQDRAASTSLCQRAKTARHIPEVHITQRQFDGADNEADAYLSWNVTLLTTVRVNTALRHFIALWGSSWKTCQPHLCSICLIIRAELAAADHNPATSFKEMLLHSSHFPTVQTLLLVFF